MENKKVIAELKKAIRECSVDGVVNKDELKKHKIYKPINAKYHNILEHFIKLYEKVRFIGTHAAGVAITQDSITKYSALKYDKKTDRWFTNYDLEDLEKIGIIKFDILGLKTLESLNELRVMTGNDFNESSVRDAEIIKEFGEGNTSGIFQFERTTAKDILTHIKTDCFDDIVAVNAMNRPGSLNAKMPEKYSANKFDIEEAMKTDYYKYTKETYGTIIYQEQLQQICINIGGMSWADADVIMKMNKDSRNKGADEFKEKYNRYKEVFVSNALKNTNMDELGSLELFDNLFNYTFNKGHACGYSLISVEEMFYKHYFPSEFWFTKMKYEHDERRLAMYEAEYVQSGHIILPSHMNGTASYSLTNYNGERCIQRGTSYVKGVGSKAAEEIALNAPYYDKEDVLDRVNKRVVNKGVILKLDDIGFFETNEKKMMASIIMANKALYSKNVRF